jgi:biotin carboxylase
MKKIMIIGAGMLQTPIIKKAKELGYSTVAVDKNPNAEGFQYADYRREIDIVDQRACLAYAKDMKIDGVLTAATDYGVLTVSRIANELGLPGLKYAVAETIKNKYTVRKIFFENNIDNTPQFFEVTDIKDILELQKKVKYPLMIKPCDGSGSRAACRADKADELLEACQKAMNASVSGKAIAETFITGKEYGVESFVEENKITVLGIMKKYMTEPPFYAELGHSVPSELSGEMRAKVQETVMRAIKILGINFGAVNMDLLITADEKVCIVDIGVRMGGNLIGSHIIPLSTGIDYVGNIIKASIGEKTSFSQTASKCISTSILSLKPGKVKNINFKKADLLHGDILNIILNISVGSTINEYHTNLDGCGYIVATGDTTQQAHNAAFELRNKIDSLIERE